MFQKLLWPIMIRELVFYQFYLEPYSNYFYHFVHLGSVSIWSTYTCKGLFPIRISVKGVYWPMLPKSNMSKHMSMLHIFITLCISIVKNIDDVNCKIITWIFQGYLTFGPTLPQGNSHNYIMVQLSFVIFDKVIKIINRLRIYIRVWVQISYKNRPFMNCFLKATTHVAWEQLLNWGTSLASILMGPLVLSVLRWSQHHIKRWRKNYENPFHGP